MKYKKHWHNFNSIEKDKTSIHLSCQQEAKSLFIKTVYNQFNLKHNISYAYSPRENVGSNGKNHIVLEQDYSKGRLKRISGDPLCKPARRFWGLESIDNKNTEHLCQQCFDKILKIIYP